MKKHLLLFFLIVTFSTRVFSQIETKTRILGGNASMIASTSGNSFFNFNPGAGFFINDHICIGASASLLYFNQDFYWGAAPFGRYYFTPKKTQSVFASSSLGISNLNSTSINFSTGVGNVWFINKNVGFETELIGSTNFEDLTVGMYLGFQFYFNKSSK
jgi:hypothetical protein